MCCPFSTYPGYIVPKTCIAGYNDCMRSQLMQLPLKLQPSGDLLMRKQMHKKLRFCILWIPDMCMIVHRQRFITCFDTNASSPIVLPQLKIQLCSVTHNIHDSSMERHRQILFLLSCEHDILGQCPNTFRPCHFK